MEMKMKSIHSKSLGIYIYIYNNINISLLAVYEILLLYGYYLCNLNRLRVINF